MTDLSNNRHPLPQEIAALQERLREAEETLQAICQREVDALVVSGPDGAQVFTLQGADHTYRILMEEMNEAAATLATDGTILYCNRRLGELAGHPLERIVGSDIRNLVLAADQAVLAGLLHRSASERAQGEVRLITATGGLLPVYLSVNTVHIANVPLLSAVLTDLSEQKRQEAFLAAERLASSILDQAAEAIVMCRPDGRVMRANVQAERLCGTNPAQRRFEEVFPLAPVEGDESFSLQSVMAGRTVRGLETRLTRRDGSELTAVCSASRVLDDADQVLGCVVTLTDITARKRAETELQHYRQNLEQLVDDRTAQLRDLYLRLQTVREEEKTRIARELHDQLGSILAVLQLDVLWLKERLAEPRLVEKANLVAQGIGEALQTTRRIQTQLRPAVLDDLGLSEALRWQCRVFQKHTGIRCHVHTPEEAGTPMHTGTATALFRIFQEALTNVAKHAGASRVEVWLRDDGVNVSLEVADNGTGIADAARYSSTGYGIRGMAERAVSLGGSLEITGEPGGTRVVAKVPKVLEGAGTAGRPSGHVAVAAGVLRKPGGADLISRN